MDGWTKAEQRELTEVVMQAVLFGWKSSTVAYRHRAVAVTLREGRIEVGEGIRW